MWSTTASRIIRRRSETVILIQSNYWSSSAGVEPAPPGHTARRSHRTKLPEGPARSESNRRRPGFNRMLYQLSYEGISAEGRDRTDICTFSAYR